MRNIKEYPITIEETIATMTRLQAKALNSKSVGSIEPLVLSYINQYLSENKLSLIDFLARKQIK